MAEVAGRVDWNETIRRAPVGVLVMAGALCFLAAGLVLGGSYLALSTSDAGWVAITTIFAAGPLLLYVGLHLLRLTRWAWLAMVMLLLLLLLSSVARMIVSPEAGLSPVGEMIVEAAVLFYLWRPAVRAAFGRA